MTGALAQVATLVGKDLRIAIDTAKSIGAFAPLAERVSELWSEAVEKLGYDLEKDKLADLKWRLEGGGG